MAASRQGEKECGKLKEKDKKREGGESDGDKKKKVDQRGRKEGKKGREWKLMVTEKLKGGNMKRQEEGGRCKEQELPRQKRAKVSVIKKNAHMICGPINKKV